MAIKVTLSKKDLARALIDKNTPRYANKPTWGPYSYEQVIYPQARIAFQNLYPTHLYPTNEEFNNRFIKDYYKSESKLMEMISSKNPVAQEVSIGQTEAPIEQIASAEPASTMTATSPTSASPAPRIPNFPRIPNSLTNQAQNIGSSASIFAKKGGTRVFQGFTNILGETIGAGGRGLGNFVLRLVNGVADRIQATSSLRNRFRVPNTNKAKLAWALFGAFFLLVFVGGIIGGITGNTPTVEAPGTTSSSGVAVNLAQCSFSGASGTLKVGNPTLADMVSDISAKVGVPGSLIMGILRIESNTAFTNKDPNYLANDYDATPSSAGAIGITQFLPATFAGIFNNNKDDISRKFQKNTVLTSVEPASIPPPNDQVMRITSIRDSIIMTAYKIKDDKNAGVGSAAPWDETAARLVARRYYGACSYEGASGSYCQDLADSFNNCQNALVNLADTSGVIQIVSGIQNACSGGVVSVANLSCLNSINPSLPDTIDKQIRASTLAYYYLQCVGFVKALASWVNNETLNDHGVANAYDYEAIPPQNYRFISKTDNSAIIGDIAIWNNSPNGHVAYVIGIESENRFSVAEASWGGQGRVRGDRIIDRISEPGFRGWARKQ